MATHNQQNTQSSTNRLPMSARKLAATLWELQELSLSGVSMPCKVVNEATEYCAADVPGRRMNPAPLPVAPPSPASSNYNMRTHRRSSVRCRIGESVKRKPPAAAQAQAAAAQLQWVKLLESVKTADSHEEDHKHQQIEVDNGTTPPQGTVHSKTISNSDDLSPSAELLKVLDRVWALEHEHKSCAMTMETMRSDLMKAQSEVDDLTGLQAVQQQEMEKLSKRLSEEKKVWQDKEQEKTKQAHTEQEKANQVILLLREDLEEEKKAKHKLEIVHSKLMKEFMDVNKSLMKTLQDLERERKARELMEDVCDELAREVGEDKARVEEIKRESYKVMEEVEEERKMLQLAEVWREERVQMKLAEARLEIEEKNAALDKLRTQLNTFLKTKRSIAAEDRITDKDLKMSIVSADSKDNDQSSFSATTNPVKMTDDEDVKDQQIKSPGTYQDVEIKGTILTSGSESDDEETDGDDDDLQSIELTKEDFRSRVEEIHWAKPKSIQQEIDAEIRMPSDWGHFNVSESVIKHGIEKGDGSEDGKVKPKLWSFELKSPWRKENKEDRYSDKEELHKSSDNDSSFMKDNKEVTEVKCSKGDHNLYILRDESEGSNNMLSIGNASHVSDHNTSNDEDVGSSTPSKPTMMSHEVTSNHDPWGSDGHASLIDNHIGSGSSKEVKSMMSFSGMQQCASPTRQWDAGLRSPDLTKDKSFKGGKSIEVKSETKHHRFRIGKRT